MRSSTFLVLSALPVLAIITAVACANSDSDPEGGNVTANAACTSYVASLCAKYDSCTQGLYTQYHFGGATQCQARELVKCIGTLSAPGNTATPNGIKHCGDAFAALTCTDFFDQSNVPSSCTPRPGPRADGDPCVDNGQCLSTWCYAPATAGCGICGERPEAGAPCNTNTDCGSAGLLCADNNACAPAAAPGAPCNAATPCGFAYQCVGAEGGTCVQEGEEAGVGCDVRLVTAATCESDFGLYCAGVGDAGDRCATANVVGASANCGDVTASGGIPDAGAPHTFAKCNAGGECDPQSAKTGTCSAPSADGTPCDSANGPPCLKPASCVPSDGGTAGTCIIVQTNRACD